MEQKFKIAIKFGDNDFINTFTGVLNVLFLSFKYHGSLPEDKKKLCFLINSLAPTMYMIHQLHDVNQAIDSAMNDESLKKTSTYITSKVTPDRILVNKEVDEYVKSENVCFNSEVFILDTTLNSNNIYTL